ncbi:MAG: heat shock protein transcriptional repressor HspR [Anaerolineae bacterium]
MTFEPLDERLPLDEPAYVISVAAKLVCLHPQTLRYYERLGLVKPDRTDGRIRLYSRRNIERLRKIARLTEDLGVNLAGVEVILNMTQRVSELQDELEAERLRFQADMESLLERIRELEAMGGPERPNNVINVSPTQVTNVDESQRDDRSDVPAIVP